MVEIGYAWHQLSIIFLPLYAISFLASALYLFRVIAAIFSPAARSILKKGFNDRPGFYALLFLSLPVTALFIATTDLQSLKVRQERKIAFQRVHQAGGWETIKRDCRSLTNRWTDSKYFQWFGTKESTNQLPPAIAALNPRRVECYEDTSAHTPIAYIHVVGLPSTDNGWPSYGFLFFFGNEPREDILHRFHHSKLIANSIYEVY